MTVRAVEEALVPREEAGTVELEQERDDRLVGDPLSRYVDTDLARANPLAEEELALAFRDVLIETDQATTGSSVYSST